ncbi:MAG: hypothetical protein LLG45_09930 [Actinomycetia bacterium]|nr:hypothetical protein [Actinomycetes bacterium]
MSKTHLVGHLLREIESALRDVLEPFATKDDAKDASRCGKSPVSHADEIQSVLVALDIAQGDPVAGTWLSLAGQNSGALHRHAHRDDLDFRRADLAFDQWWECVQSVLDVVLQRFEERYTTVFKVLDALLASHQVDVSTLKNHVPSNYVVHQYFFSKLDDPAWIGPLIESGMFGHPPDPEVLDGGAGVRFPGWPIAGYLERMAAEYPEHQQAVLDAVLSVPDTPNVRVHLGLLRVALAMSPNLSKQLVPQAVRWLDGPHRPLSGVEYAKLVRHLAGGGAELEALNLASALFAVSSAAAHTWLEVAPLRLSLWEYEKSLEVALTPLAEAAPLPTLGLVSDLLEEVVGDRPDVGGNSAAGADGADMSVFWRPAIEDHEQKRDRENLRGLLAAAVRDAALVAAGREPNSVAELVTALEARRPHVFRCIALHLLRVFGHEAPDSVRAALLDRSLFGDDNLVHEYYHLLRDCFCLLSTDEQSVILGWIEEGPSKGEFIGWFTEQQGRSPSEGEIADYCDSWRVKKLMPISESLPSDWKQRFDSLVARLGVPEHPDFSVYRGTWVGPTSPLALEDLQAMEPGELLQYLREWVPSREWDAPTPEGLGRLVAAAVADEPSRYLPVLGSLRGVEATYVRSFLEGFRQAAEAGKPFDWGPVLDLAGEVVQSPWPTPSLSGPVEDRDADWGLTRKTIAAVIEAGLGTGVSQIPISFREDLWAILEPLTDDPDPGPDDEKRYGEGGFDDATMSINTVRGRAMHAVVEYGLWVKRNATDTQCLEQDYWSDKSLVPEIWPVLDRHLDLDRDPSLAVRSVYGQWFPWIHLLSPDWARSNVDRLFPRGPERVPWWTAAWVGYVTHTAPYDDVLPVLRPVYEHAVELMTQDEEPLLFGDRPSERLGEHLATYICRGKIAIEPVDSVFEEYWAKADPNLRHRVLSYIGASLREWPSPGLDPGAPAALDHLKALWAFVVSQAGQPGKVTALGVTTAATELSAFAWWFSSGQFDDDWAFDQLGVALRATSLLDDAHLVVEHLANVVDRRPLRSVRALDKLVQSDHEGWRIAGWEDEARKVVEAAMQSPDEDVRRASVRLINRLVSKGYLDFRDLMGTDPEQEGDGPGG